MSCSLEPHLLDISLWVASDSLLTCCQKSGPISSIQLRSFALCEAGSSSLQEWGLFKDEMSRLTANNDSAHEPEGVIPRDSESVPWCSPALHSWLHRCLVHRVFAKEFVPKAAVPVQRSCRPP